MAVGKIGIKKPKGKIDLPFLILVLVILTIGLIMLFSASYVDAFYSEGDSFHFIKRQLIFAVIGIIGNEAVATPMVIVV